MITHRAVFCLSLLMAAPLAAQTCDNLPALKLANTTITSAKTIAAGTFTMPPGTPASVGSVSFKKLSDFCRVEGVLQPSPDSHIEFEVWLPAFKWNGRIQGAGNGGFAGSINYPGLAASV